MKNDTAIKVENLGKKYQIGKTQAHSTLRDTLVNLVKNPFARNHEEEIWALKDVSFEVKKGEVLGVIGPNGAGKSTLLKILTQITKPTTGKIQLRGRVSSLLEVGTGFHSELTGRENVYMNGSILGMSRNEIESKFDDIVEFSGLRKFLDTPVKRYSSGMRVRLAFSVAAHLEPEILLIDEVLAVGDAEFQKKCLGKMDEVSKESGRTIIFVSHDMNAIERLCDKAIYLNNGRIFSQNDNVKNIIDFYLFGDNKRDEIRSHWSNKRSIDNNDYFYLEEFYIGDNKGKVINTPINNDKIFWVYIKGILKKVDRAFNLGYALYAKGGQLVYWTGSTDTPVSDWPKLKKGEVTFKSQIPKHFLNEGIYRLELIGSLHNIKWLYKPQSSSPAIFLSIKGGLSNSPLFVNRRPGLLAPILKWEISE